jgi:SAM-dependent methyltransferase
MAKAYPNAKLFGFDTHAPSIEHARKAAKEAGVGDRITFSVASAHDFPGENYDLIAFSDCLHDMGDPVGAMKRAGAALAQDGSALIVEPMAADAVEGNFNPIGRTFSAASTLCCTANSWPRTARLLARSPRNRRFGRRRSEAASRPSAAPPKRPSTASSRRGNDSTPGS